MNQIAIISENIIFTKMLDSYLRRKVSKCLIIQFSSFPDIEKIIDRTYFDLIIVDGNISGVASFDIVNYLRLDKKVICPIYYFSDVHNDYLKIKPYIKGINFHYNKPFDAHTVTNEIAAFLSTKSQLIS